MASETESDLATIAYLAGVADEKARGRAAVAELVEALKPFADCVEQISDDEDDEEWAKFRLLIKDYRRAAKTISRHQAGLGKGGDRG